MASRLKSLIPKRFHVIDGLKHKQFIFMILNHILCTIKTEEDSAFMTIIVTRKWNNTYMFVDGMVLNRAHR